MNCINTSKLHCSLWHNIASELHKTWHNTSFFSCVTAEIVKKVQVKNTFTKGKNGALNTTSGWDTSSLSQTLLTVTFILDSLISNLVSPPKKNQSHLSPAMKLIECLTWEITLRLGHGIKKKEVVSPQTRQITFVSALFCLPVWL